MILWAFLIYWITCVQSSNILTIIPFPSYSHQQPLLSISAELARRGHNLTVITTNPPKKKIPNYQVIDISSAYFKLVKLEKEIGFTLQREWTDFSMVRMMAPLLSAICDYELSLPQVQDFIRDANGTIYDLVLIEDFLYSSFGGLVHKIGSPPVVGVHTFPFYYVTDWAMGVPINPSYMPDMFVGFTDRMSFFQRVHCTVYYWYLKYEYEMRMFPFHERLLRKYFGTDPPPARDFEYNKSLVLVPTDFTMTYPQPLPPNVIQIGPLHLKTPKPLTEDLERWFDEAEDGVVYFSLGSNMKGTSLQEDKRNAFVKAFEKFPKIRFLWKWESDTEIPGVSSNVLTRKWFPQQDIFGHPKVRLFITQGGLQSCEEIIHHGVPVLGIPLFGDQRHNTWKLAKEGAGISMELHEISYDSVHKALKQMLYDNSKSYKENAMRLSNIANDQLVPAMDMAVWWVEYVIRHNGARHLRLASLDLHWYQYILIDVYGFLLSVVLILSYAVFKSVRLILSAINKDNKQKSD